MSEQRRITLWYGKDIFQLIQTEDNLWRIKPNRKIQYGINHTTSKISFVRFGKHRILRVGSEFLSYRIIELFRTNGQNFIRLS